MASFIPSANPFASAYGGRSVNFGSPVVSSPMTAMAAPGSYKPLSYSGMAAPVAAPATVAYNAPAQFAMPELLVQSAPVAELEVFGNTYTPPSAGDVLRVSVANLKPGKADAVKDALGDQALTGPLTTIPGSKFIAAFVTGENKLVTTALYDSMQSSENATPIARQTFGSPSLSENFVAPPTVYRGTVEFYYRGPAKLKGESVSSRVTVFPLKPGVKGAVLDLLNNKMLQQMLKDDLFAQLIDMRAFFSEDDTLLLVSRFKRLSGLIASEPKQKEFLAPLIPYVGGAPERLFGTLEWAHPKILVIKRPEVKKTGCC